jgi:hypothetical protein
MHSPLTSHWSAAKRVLRYLKHTIDHGLFYSRGSLQLQAPFVTQIGQAILMINDLHQALESFLGIV